MSKQRSFALSDFSLREVPGAIVAYVILSVICVLAGLTLESVPPSWRGLFSGMGLGLCIALILLTLLLRRQAIDSTNLPEPSAEVRRICEDPDLTLAEAVKAYRGETGCGLAEATAVVKGYPAKARPAGIEESAVQE
jgi:hypothetical protein